jgi:hypothetical protein
MAEEVAGSFQDAVNATVGGLLVLEESLIYSIREGGRRQCKSRPARQAERKR